jgi:hypothetical protein
MSDETNETLPGEGEDEVIIFPPQGDEEEKSPKKSRGKKKSSKIQVKRLLPNRVEGGKYYFYVTLDFVDGYLVPVDMAGDEKELWIDPESSEIVVAERWDNEITAMLPSEEELRHNIRLSLWRAGAVSQESAESNHVKRRALRTAFPYRFETISKE